MNGELRGKDGKGPRHCTALMQHIFTDRHRRQNHEQNLDADRILFKQKAPYAVKSLGLC